MGVLMHDLNHGHRHGGVEPTQARAKGIPVIGVGGPVGSGKTALVEALCRRLRDRYSLAAVTNDIFTKIDAEILTSRAALPVDRIVGVETGGCPHTAIREDASHNQEAIDDLLRHHPDVELIFLESGGDNLAATFSPELVDYVIYVIDVAGGDKIPRKGGPGITRSDLLIINKMDLLTEAELQQVLEFAARTIASRRDALAAAAAALEHGDGDIARLADGLTAALQAVAAALPGAVDTDVAPAADTPEASTGRLEVDLGLKRNEFLEESAEPTAGAPSLRRLALTVLPVTTVFLLWDLYAVAAGHYLAATAAITVLEEGGNAVDAGCAAGLALGVLLFDEIEEHDDVADDHPHQADDPQEGHEAEGLTHAQESNQGPHHAVGNG